MMTTDMKKQHYIKPRTHAVHVSCESVLQSASGETSTGDKLKEDGEADLGEGRAKENFGIDWE